MSLPTDPKERKQYPIASGVLDYFPDAIAEVAHVSWVGNEQHNPGQPLHWAKEKSTDHPDALLRHLKDRGTRDSDGMRHSAKVAWRALPLLQTEIEAERFPAVAHTNAEDEPTVALRVNMAAVGAAPAPARTRWVLPGFDRDR